MTFADIAEHAPRLAQADANCLHPVYVKGGFVQGSRTQRYRCRLCGKSFTKEPNPLAKLPDSAIARIAADLRAGISPTATALALRITREAVYKYRGQIIEELFRLGERIRR
jgi:transposase-like protein